VTKIVPEADAKQNYTTTVDRDSKLSGDRIVTQVYALQYESANQLVAVLRPLITPNNTIVAYPNTNTLVITDYADNLKRINKIIDSIDQPSQGELSVIPLKYASALDLSQALLKLMPEAAVQQAAPGVTPRFYIAADTRTNSLLVRAENPSYVQRVRSLVASLDTAAAAPSSIALLASSPVRTPLMPIGPVQISRIQERSSHVIATFLSASLSSRKGMGPRPGTTMFGSVAVPPCIRYAASH